MGWCIGGTLTGRCRAKDKKKTCPYVQRVALFHVYAEENMCGGEQETLLIRTEMRGLNQMQPQSGMRGRIFTPSELSCCCRRSSALSSTFCDLSFEQHDPKNVVVHTAKAKKMSTLHTARVCSRSARTVFAFGDDMDIHHSTRREISSSFL